MTIRKLRSAIICLAVIAASAPMIFAAESNSPAKEPDAAATNGTGGQQESSKVEPQQSTQDSTYLDGWRMAGANPQRTSWVPEDVPGRLELEWYKPFEAYMSHKTQIVAANDLLYVSTARGLYALRADTGEEVWVYPTELPIGHSPTVVNGVAYMGCFDRRIHAVNAITGQRIWTSEPAGAGFDTNPLVVEGKVVAGSRDGVLYCFDAATGATLWTHATDLKQPIRFSCAYKDGALYFAANDCCAYAVNINTGSRLWKSSKLPGAGFFSWWPVVHGKYVIFTGSSNYRHHGFQRALQASILGLDDRDIFGSGERQKGYGGAVVSENPLRLDLSKKSEPEGNGPVTEYLKNKPWRRTYFLLDRSDGSEVMFDFNGDGEKEYAPMAYYGTHSGTRFPPVIGADGKQYLLTGAALASPYISRGGICRWDPGSPEIEVLVVQAHDEPTAIAGGGNHIHYYHGEWDDGTQGSVNVVNGTHNSFYWYIYKIEPQVCEYLRTRPNNMYGTHGDQNPGIPYKGKVYNQKWGHVLCWSTKGDRKKLPVIKIKDVESDSEAPKASDLKSRLAAEVQRMIDAGHLRPGWLNRGLAAVNLEDAITDRLDDYYSQPGLTIDVLIRALPHLPNDMRQPVRDYIASEFKNYPPDKYAHIGWQGAAREIEDLPPEMAAGLKGLGPLESSAPHLYQAHVWLYDFPPHSNYSLYKYAQEFGNADELVGRLRPLKVPAKWALRDYPWALNSYIAGFAGIVGLKKLAGQNDPEAEAQLERLLELRAENFQTDRPKGAPIELTVSRNFMYMVPELADYLHKHIPEKIASAVETYNRVHPYWFVSRACEGSRTGDGAALGENAVCPLWDAHTLFQAKAQILREPYEKLVRYLDVAAYWRGDLYYIDNLCAALEAAERKSAPN